MTPSVSVVVGGGNCEPVGARDGNEGRMPLGGSDGSGPVKDG